jgi:Tol biopolymer transport system component
MDEERRTPPRQNGEWIAVIKTDGNVWLVHPDGNNSQQITEDASPVIDHNLYRPGVVYHTPKWSNTGDKLAFMRLERDDDYTVINHSLILYDLSSRQLRTLVEATGGGFDWGPEGEMIVFDMPYKAIQTDPLDVTSLVWEEYDGLWVVEVDSNERELLLPPHNGQPLLNPDWSPDGGHIFFEDTPICYECFQHGFGMAEYGKSTYSVWDQYTTLSCDWSPNGEHLACVDIPYLAYPPCRIRILNQEGEMLQEFTNDEVVCDLYPRWSPDGSSIAVNSNVGDGMSPLKHFIEVLHPETSDRKRIYEITSYGSLIAWTPDGSKLLIAPEEGMISLIDINTHEVTSLTEGYEAAWQPQPLLEPTPAPSATPTTQPVTEVVTEAPEADPSEEEGADTEEESSGPVALLRQHPLLIAVLALGLFGILGVGVVGAVLITRARPSSARAVWAGCGTGVVLLLILVTAVVILVTISSGERTSTDVLTPTVTPQLDAAVDSPTLGAIDTSSRPISITSTSTPSTDPFVNCGLTPTNDIEVGDQMYVCTGIDSLALYAQPGLEEAGMSMLEPGTALSVAGGPVCEDGWLWWLVTTDTSGRGWVVDRTDKNDTLYLCEIRPCEQPFTGPFADVASTMQDELGCQTGNAFQGLVAEEHFEGGIMFWRENLDQARSPVLFSDGTWRYYTHAPFVEGSPEFSCIDENTPAQCPPTPKRGFGLMWCNLPDLRQQLGKAIDCERGYQATMQSFTQGFLLRNDQGRTYALFDDGEWRVLR